MEASADFAIRIYAASVNVVFGVTSKQFAEDVAQDYVLAPLQNRLDEFLVRAGTCAPVLSSNLCLCLLARDIQLRVKLLAKRFSEAFKFLLLLDFVLELHSEAIRISARLRGNMG
jgi:hypothetical protein